MAMDSKGHRYMVLKLVSAPMTKTKELIKMNGKRQNKEIWSVRRQFEPNRLAHDIMAQAYEQVVPQKIRVLNGLNNRSEAMNMSYKSARRLK